MRAKLGFGLIGLIFVLWATQTFPDEITLSDGLKREGRLLKDADRIIFETAYGVVSYPREEVLAIDVQHQSLVEKFYDDLNKIIAEKDKQKVADELYKLSLWARKENLKRQESVALRKIIQVVPDHKFARERLGYVLYEGQWLTKEEANRRKGLQLHEGKWISPAAEEIQKLKQELVKLEEERIRQEREQRRKERMQRLKEKREKEALEEPIYRPEYCLRCRYRDLGYGFRQEYYLGDWWYRYEWIARKYRPDYWWYRYQWDVDWSIFRRR